MSGDDGKGDRGVLAWGEAGSREGKLMWRLGRVE